MKRTAIIAGLALTSLLFVSCSEETAEAKVKNLNAEIADIQKEIEGKADGDKSDLEKKLKELKTELKDAMSALAEEAGDKAKEAGDKLKEGVDGLLDK